MSNGKLWLGGLEFELLQIDSWTNAAFHEDDLGFLRQPLQRPEIQFTVKTTGELLWHNLTGEDILFVAQCDDTSFSGKFNVRTVKVNDSVDGVSYATIYGRLTSPITTTKIVKEDKMLKKLDRDSLKANRFYVGSKQALERAWGHKTLPDAIAHGTQLLESTDGSEQFIVKIIKVIRRKPQPVVVEDVK